MSKTTYYGDEFPKEGLCVDNKLLDEKAMQTHYLNVYKCEKGFFCEMEALTKFEDVLQDIIDASWPYGYTLKIGLHETKRLDLEKDALLFNSEEPEDHSLTVEQMGLTPNPAHL